MPSRRTFDRRYELDWRSLDFPVTARRAGITDKPRSAVWPLTYWLDQGTEGACVGFATAHELLARPSPVRGVDKAYARRIYLSAQRIDQWPGGAYPGAVPFMEGTSILSAAKVCKTLGFYRSYQWGLSLEETARGLAYSGPAVLGISWYEGMDRPDARGFLRPVGSIRGGHAILMQAIRVVYRNPLRRSSWADVDWHRSYVVLHNSWGRSWGTDGRAKLSLADLGHLLADQGEACFPQRTVKAAV